MATLTVNGVKVQVDDSFKSLSPEQQESTVNEIAAQLGKSKPAGADEGGFSGDRFNSSLNASASGFANGIPIVGPYLNEGLNKAEAGLRTLVGDETYQQELDGVHARERADIKANPVTHGAAEVTGGVYGMAPAIMAAPTAFGAGGGGIASRMIAGSLSGSAVGTADSGVRSGGDGKEMVKGGLMGFGAGIAGPVVGKAVGSGIRYFNRAAPDALSGLSKPAVEFVESQIGNPARVSVMRQNLATMGDEAMLADVSPAWLGIARGAATQPTMRDQIVDALVNRGKGTVTRLSSDADRFLGPRVIPSQIEEGLEAGRGVFAQEYGPVMANARDVDTQPLAEALDNAAANLRGPERTANRQVRGFLNEPDVRVDGQPVLDTSPRSLHATREAIDGMMRDETNGNVIRALTNARAQVDDALAEAAPGIKAVDARMHELFRQSEGLKQGRPILSNEAGALRPEEVQDMFVRGSQPQGELVGPSAEAARMRNSVRAEFDRAVGTNANDDTALRRIVRGEGDWNRDKLGYIFGQNNADGALAAIDREAAFRDTANRVTRGSDTAMADQFGTFLKETANAGHIPADVSLTGLGLKGVKAVGESLVERNAAKTAAKFANEIGNLSVAQGATRDAIVDALIQRAQTIERASDPRIRAIVNALTQTSAQQSLR